MLSGDGRSATVDERALLIACFAFGVVLQAAFLLRGDRDPLKIGVCVILSLVVGLYPYGAQQPYDGYSHGLVVIYVFAVSFAVLFSNDVLSLVTERSVLFYTVLLWFAFFTYGYEATSAHNAVMAIMAVPTAITAYRTFRETANGFWTRLFLYAWFLCTIVGIGLLQFPFANLAIFFEDESLPWTTPLDSFAAGMAFMFLAVNATYLFLLVRRDRTKDWHELTQVMTQRLLAEDLNLPALAVFFLVLICMLVLEHVYRWVPPGLLLNLLLVMPAIVLMRLSVTPNPEAAADLPARVPHSRHLLKKLRRKSS